ncbi:globin-coupled sensor protein [Mongoliimonas terrestris]|uniref:globin-coupled sensor protein n=1 Tax=Mongoliimonas terrestris TaxID=1709001 RepID=UPI000AF7B7B0|nr:globin-coupled sensor protein [Mongoliimonas terrestris]
MQKLDVSRQLHAFGLSAADLASLRALRPVLQDALDAILVESRSHFAAWPDIERALADPSMHKARFGHWMMAATGDFGADFADSALRFAASFVERKIPAHAVVLCHHAVLDVATGRLDAHRPRSRFGLGGKAVRAHGATLDALRKAAWFDIEVLMEAYAIASEMERGRLLEGIAAGFEKAVGGVVEEVGRASGDLRSAAKSLSTSSDLALAQSSAVAAASEQASANVQTVASAAEELTSSIAEIARQVHEASNVAQRAVGDADRTAVQIRDLSASAQRIGEVVDLINTIAAQTNLLALNATIEAARAGDAGRGFAVVAAEVKQLADQTAKATRTISEQIGGIQSATDQAVSSVAEISGVIGHLNGISTAIATAVEQQGAATREIAENVSQASAGTAEVSGNIGGVSRSTSSTADASRGVLSSSEALSRQAEVLKVEVGSFLASVRAA